VYRLGARFNHSCKPNVNRCWIESLQMELFHATQDISAGEELCVYYVDPKGLFSQRQAVLREDFNFTCRCGTCSLPEAQGAASDRLRQEYQDLDERAPKVAAEDPDEAVDLILRVLEIIQEEFDGDPHMAQRAFNDGFQFAVLAGDLDLAQSFLQRAHEAKVLAEGDHAESRELLKLAENPGLHPLVQASSASKAPGKAQTRFCEDFENTCSYCGPDTSCDKSKADHERASVQTVSSASTAASLDLRSLD
ncbi:unnamed protein product, partial [Polarella glacialis]